MKVCVLFRDLGHYHDARLARAAAEGLDLCAVTTSASASFPQFAPSMLQRSYEVVALYPDLAAGSAGARRGDLARRVAAALDRLAPDVVAVAGWSEPACFAAIAWARGRRRGIVLMSESQARDAVRRPWRELFKRWVVRACQAALVGGRRHRDYVVLLGMPPGRVVLGYDAVDNDHFARGADAARADAARLRREHGLPERFILAVARFVPKKNLAALVAAYAAYAAGAADPHYLVLLGDGPQRQALAAQVERLGIGRLVRLPGFAAYDLLPVYYGLASLLVHASLVEQWGLVVNEAMAAGLPVLVSERCGCAEELVRDGVNGFAFDPVDIPALASLLSRQLSRGGERLAAMGNASRAIVADWGTDRFANGLRTAVAIAGEARRRRFPPWERALFGLLGRMRFERVT